MTSTAEGYELSITRLIDAPVATVWRIWVEQLAEWWAPKPWTTRVIENDMRAGGRMALVMRGPAGETTDLDGEGMPMEGVYLEVSEHRRIVFTNALKVGWVPQPPFMVGMFEFAEEDGKTRYTAGARHWDAAAMKQHEEMGFVGGWTSVAAQLAALAEAEEAG